MKKYKTCPPEETIVRIKKILQNNGLETTALCSDNHFSSCRITLTTNGLENLGIGTNGKGRNKEYSLASGYGEFMERLQNRILFENYRFDEVGKRLDFVYAADEEFWNKKQMLKNCSNILKKSYKIDTNKELTEFVNNPQIDESQLVLPFYSVFDNKLIMLPYQLLRLYSDEICLNGRGSKNAL